MIYTGYIFWRFLCRNGNKDGIITTEIKEPGIWFINFAWKGRWLPTTCLISWYPGCKLTISSLLSRFWALLIEKYRKTPDSAEPEDARFTLRKTEKDGGLFWLLLIGQRSRHGKCTRLIHWRFTKSLALTTCPIILSYTYHIVTLFLVIKFTGNGETVISVITHRQHDLPTRREARQAMEKGQRGQLQVQLRWVVEDVITILQVSFKLGAFSSIYVSDRLTARCRFTIRWRVM